ncbi:hypothetical protein [Stutzerimonas nitrititolerans]|uniref:hypothetical protein n=1 Tax=Stutzerimonas nitrititolerans TaxID=2482751 RepID=UPI002898B121|nr:hypothetical protein [Stutzerimonas nitrititolerans]
MNREHFHEMTSWISSTSAGTSLALVVFIPSADGLDNNLKTIALCFFISCLPLFTACAVLCREVKLNNYAEPGLTQRLGFLFTPAMLLFLAGFAALCLAIGPEILATLLISIIWVCIFLKIPFSKETGTD